jgi:hypothetical protein
MSKWWKVGIILGLTIVGLILVLIFLDEFKGVLCSILATLGLGSASEVVRRERRISPNTVSDIPQNRTVIPGEPDNSGFVQLTPTIEDIKEEETPEGTKPEDVNNIVEISITPPSIIDQPGVETPEGETLEVPPIVEKPPTTNHFVSRLSRGERERKDNSGQ